MKFETNLIQNINLDEIAKRWIELVLAQIIANEKQKTIKPINKNGPFNSHE